MLSNLTVSNLAVVERAEVAFERGLNVLTGETGAGKSVLMGALELVLGARADSTIVRDGASDARVEALFDLSKEEKILDGINFILEDSGLTLCEDKELIIRRVVSVNGTSKVWVNDCSTTVATLKRLGSLLVDIHGPRANQQVLEEKFQRNTLDSYGNIDKSNYALAWNELSKIRERIKELESSSISEDEIDLLRYQVSECEEAKLSEEDETLADRHMAAAHAEEVMLVANEVTDSLGGDGGVVDILAKLQPHLNSLSKHLSEAGDWSEEVEDISVRVQELSRTIADSLSRIDADPEAMEELDARLTVVNRLKRKYGKGGTIADLLKIIEEKKARLKDLENREEVISQLKAKEVTAKKAVLDAGDKLTKKRLLSSEKLSKAVTKELRDLGFLQAKFSVKLSPCDATNHGCDKVEYLFEPNPGESARALAAIASSGETARVMLAIKSVLASHDQVATLVFDEIDANIGGEVGHAVGEKMKAVALYRQVIAITHLPQSAVYGDRHLVVAKSVSNGRTRTSITPIEGEERIKEISRMLGGAGESKIVAAHAEELLKNVK